VTGSTDSLQRFISLSGRFFGFIAPKRGARAEYLLFCRACKVHNRLNSSFQDGKVAFDRVRVGVVPDIFFLRVVHRVMGDEPTASLAVDVGLVRHESAVLMGMPGNERRKVARGDIRDMKTANPATTLDQGEYRSRARSGRS
jgi:hypothetical protein